MAPTLLQVPSSAPTGQGFINVAGGENLFFLASRFLGDATQWWRIAALNAFPGQPLDFIVKQVNVVGFPILLIPKVNPNATDPS